MSGSQLRSARLPRQQADPACKNALSQSASQLEALYTAATSTTTRSMRARGGGAWIKS